MEFQTALIAISLLPVKYLKLLVTTATCKYEAKNVSERKKLPSISSKIFMAGARPEKHFQRLAHTYLVFFLENRMVHKTLYISSFAQKIFHFALFSLKVFHFCGPKKPQAYIFCLKLP